MDYQEAWAFLNDLQFFKIKLGLESMSAFLGSLGNPQQQLKFVHVAGTNGKGSVCANLLAILNRSGYRVGVYTSPHLTSVRERFRIDAEYIPREEFAAEASAIRRILAGRQITYFEFTTALALLWFARRQVDLVLLEVGLGGRLDATNVVTPLVGVVTNVAMDHEAYLGTTLAEIAAEKAGIVKPGVPLVSAIAPGLGREVLSRTCREKGAPLYLLGRDFQISGSRTVPGPTGELIRQCSSPACGAICLVTTNRRTARWPWRSANFWAGRASR
jgi:dihydrofolate synthase / folylpolyglutamate synthase